MRRNLIETMMGAVVLLVAAIFVVLAFQSTGTMEGGDGYRVSAQFDDVSGVSSGTEVRMAGVKIGTVVDQRLDPRTFFAILEMHIDKAVELPTDSSVRIIPDGLLGGNYLAIEPGGAEEIIEAGGAISHTQGTINVVDLLGRFIFSAADQASQMNQGAPGQQ